jgi:hypothetical protein
MTSELRPLNPSEINLVSGGFVCGGLCVLGGIVAGVGLFATGVAIGEKVYQATHRK